MDPIATLESIRESLAKGDRHEAFGAVIDYMNWRQRMGFAAENADLILADVLCKVLTELSSRR
jgi:hypothetical protein